MMSLESSVKGSLFLKNEDGEYSEESFEKIQMQ